jgi:hypothetical protein
LIINDYAVTAKMKFWQLFYTGTGKQAFENFGPGNRITIRFLLRPLVEYKFFYILKILLLLYGGAGGVDN